MNETRVGTDVLGKVGQEGDHVVVGFELDVVDACDLELGLLPDRARRRRRDDTQRRLGVAGMRLDLEPDAETILRLPDRAHRGAAIAGDHLSSCPCFIASMAYSSACRGATGNPGRSVRAGRRAYRGFVTSPTGVAPRVGPPTAMMPSDRLYRSALHPALAAIGERQARLDWWWIFAPPPASPRHLPSQRAAANSPASRRCVPGPRAEPPVP